MRPPSSLSPSPSRLLVTGFLAFGHFADNPSATLAAALGQPHALLEVSYDAVDRFLDGLDDHAFDVLLMVGVSSHVTSPQLERVARNQVGELADIRGVVRGPAPIEIDGPASVVSSLWTPTMCETVRAAGGGGDGGGDASPALSDDAGCYVCNYAYFRALRRFPRRRVGFVHVPPVSVMPLERQRATLGEIVELVQRLAVE